MFFIPIKTKWCVNWFWKSISGFFIAVVILIMDLSDLLDLYKGFLDLRNETMSDLGRLYFKPDKLLVCHFKLTCDLLVLLVLEVGYYWIIKMCMHGIVW